MPLTREKAKLIVRRGKRRDAGVATLSREGEIFGKEVVGSPRKIIFRSRLRFMRELKNLAVLTDDKDKKGC